MSIFLILLLLIFYCYCHSIIEEEQLLLTVVMNCVEAMARQRDMMYN